MDAKEGSMMAKYQGPSFFNGEHPRPFNPDQESYHTDDEKTSSEEKRSWVEEANRFENKHAQQLPDQMMHRQEIEKEFRNYLKEKKQFHKVYEEKRSKHYIEPPFEASKVPSPIYGFKKPPEKREKVWDYGELKKDMKKEAHEFLLLEEFETPELVELWTGSNEPENKVEEQKPHTLHIKAPKKNKRKPRLHRSLSGIIEEDQSGANINKRNVPGLFSDRNSSDQS